eukprot:gene30831-37249_t
MTRLSKLQFFFDPISPYTYFALRGLEPIAAKHNLQIQVMPVLFAGLLDASGGMGPAEVPKKRHYMFLDCQRLAVINNMPFTLPPAHPFKPLLALRCALALPQDQQRTRFVRQLLDTCGDITKADTLLSVARAIDLGDGDARALLLRADSPDVKQQLREDTQRAADVGIFGVPSVLAGSALFWGSDRLAHLDLHLQGALAVDEAQLRRTIDSRPRAADRRGRGDRSQEQ